MFTFEKIYISIKGYKILSFWDTLFNENAIRTCNYILRFVYLYSLFI